MKEPFLADRYYYYWVAPGGRAPIVEWEVILSSEVDEAALSQALATTMRAITNFRTHAVIVDGRPRHEVLDVDDIPLFEDDDTVRRIGTDDTFGYLFYVAWRGETGRTALFPQRRGWSWRIGLHVRAPSMLLWRIGPHRL